MAECCGDYGMLDIERENIYVLNRTIGLKIVFEMCCMNILSENPAGIKL
jgi:hypothetical protein